MLPALVAAAPVGAATILQGYYNVWSSGDRADHNWHFREPSHYAELKFLSNLSPDIESFVRLRVNAENDYLYYGTIPGTNPAQNFDIEDYHSPLVVAEGHIRFRATHTETFLFSRQNRFWINDEPLFGLVNDWKVKNDSYGPQAQGIRFDFWDSPFIGLGNFGGTFIYSDNGGTYNYNQGAGDIRDGDDSLIGRIRDHAWGDRIQAGVMVLRKDWTDTGAENAHALLGKMYNRVYEADLAFFPHELVDTGLHVGPIDLEQSRWTVEYSQSRSPEHEILYDVGTDHNDLFGAEIRDIHIGNLILHGWYNNAGQNYRDFMSGRFDDDRRYNLVNKHAEGIFFVPRKAITAKVTYDKEHLRVPDDTGFGLRPAETWYGELYIEFIKGFKAKVAYKRWHGVDTSAAVNGFATYPDLFSELSVENFLAKIRLQFRLHDFNTFRESSAYGFDMNVNITDHVKGYLRMLNARDSVESRQTAFAQLKYELGPGAEFYFQYGDPGQSDNIVYNDGFVNFVDPDSGRAPNSRLFTDKLALSFQTWF